MMTEVGAVLLCDERERGAIHAMSLMSLRNVKIVKSASVRV